MHFMHFFTCPRSCIKLDYIVFTFTHMHTILGCGRVQPKKCKRTHYMSSRWSSPSFTERWIHSLLGRFRVSPHPSVYCFLWHPVRKWEEEKGFCALFLYVLESGKKFPLFYTFWVAPKERKAKNINIQHACNAINFVLFPKNTFICIIKYREAGFYQTVLIYWLI